MSECRYDPSIIREALVNRPYLGLVFQQVITGRVIKSDETSACVEGRNWWQWVFISDEGVYHTIVPTRGASEIATVKGNKRLPLQVGSQSLRQSSNRHFRSWRERPLCRQPLVMLCRA
jgi:Transposase IS66 family